MDLTLQSIEDVRHLLCTLRYWISSALPEELIVYCITHSDHEVTRDPERMEVPEQRVGDQQVSVGALEDCTPPAEGRLLDKHTGRV